ncbi:hypothetical protein J2Z83_001239 [Virgibacillus natechei]|uniref:DUF2332 domain-containing protein n=1 Tax=Virgibacillus natechei TaxID=1216297 RepID=A0ABS4IDW5_9BACI|nr:DUF2332 domain-containing protein [Virgibacillus natechei]MBP1969136.1 hypothetical protein [Virgibacillus natechei]UZD14398.1 DUF2332 domain-containing protein [Virgibacillus natechei]
MDIATISERFKVFAHRECRGSSDLYEYLSEHIAMDEKLLAICTKVQQGQPIPNLFFGAVHYLLLKGTEHGLKDFYESIVESPKKTEQCFPYFKDFCQLNKDEIISVMKSRLVQTNEVRRCSYLYPSFSFVYEKVKKPLALIEIGTSAGLQLLWDKYSYSYETDVVYGNNYSTVHINGQVKGERLPYLPNNSPPVACRIGIDLHVSDLNSAEDYLWLKALIWPEHTERRDLLASAADYVKINHINFVEGDGVALLPDILKGIPEDAVICVFHTHVANQLSKQDKVQLLQHIKNSGKERDIFHLYNNIQDGDLHLDYYIDGYEHTSTVGETDSHGRWFSWNLS